MYEWDPSAGCLNWSANTVGITTCLGLYALTLLCPTWDCALWIVLLKTARQLPEQSILWYNSTGARLPDKPRSRADARDCSGLLFCTCHTWMLENKELGDNLQHRSPQRWKLVSGNGVQRADSSWQRLKWPSSSEGALDLSSVQMRAMKLFNPKLGGHLAQALPTPTMCAACPCNLVCTHTCRYFFFWWYQSVSWGKRQWEWKEQVFKMWHTLKLLSVLCTVASQHLIVCVWQTQTFLLDKHRCRQQVLCQQIGLGLSPCVTPSATGGCCFGGTNADGQVQDKMPGLLWLCRALTAFHTLSYTDKCG